MESIQIRCCAEISRAWIIGALQAATGARSCNANRRWDCLESVINRDESKVITCNQMLRALSVDTRRRGPTILAKNVNTWALYWGTLPWRVVRHGSQQYTHGGQKTIYMQNQSMSDILLGWGIRNIRRPRPELYYHRKSRSKSPMGYRSMQVAPLQ